MTGPRLVVVREDAFRAEGGPSTFDVRWEAVLRVVRTPDFLAFYFNPIQAVILPRRVFRDEAELEEIARMAEARAGVH